MTERETVDDWLANLGSAHFRLDQNGVCACCHDDGGEVVVEVPDGSGQVFLLRLAPARAAARPRGVLPGISWSSTPT